MNSEFCESKHTESEDSEIPRRSGQMFKARTAIGIVVMSTGQELKLGRILDIYKPKLHSKLGLGASLLNKL